MRGGGGTALIASPPLSAALEPELESELEVEAGEAGVESEPALGARTGVRCEAEEVEDEGEVKSESVSRGPRSTRHNHSHTPPPALSDS